MAKVVLATFDAPEEYSLKVEKIGTVGENRRGRTYRIYGPRGNYIEMSRRNLYALADLLDDVYEAIEAGEF